MRNQINKDKSLTLDDKVVLVKEKDDYLGDTLHESGLSASAHATVSKRCGKIFSLIIEISSILDDFRIDSLGGLKAGLDIYELALVPSLLYNDNVSDSIRLDFGTKNSSFEIAARSGDQ